MEPAEPAKPHGMPAWVGVVGRLVAVGIALALLSLFSLPRLAIGQPAQPLKQPRPAAVTPLLVHPTTAAPASPAPAGLPDATSATAQPWPLTAIGRAISQQPATESPSRVIRSNSDGLAVDEDALNRIAQALGPRFAQIRSQHFVILSDADRRWSDQRLRLLEATQREVRRTMQRLGMTFQEPEQRMLVILFDQRDDYQAFASAHDGVVADWVAGYYATGPNHVVFYHDRTRPDLAAASQQIEAWHKQANELRREAIRVRARESAEAADAIFAQARSLETHATVERQRLETLTEETATAKVTHEASHLIAFNCGLQSRNHLYPFWLTEGWATNFETGSTHRPFGPDHDFEPRASSWELVKAEGRWMPMHAFITMTQLDTNDASEASDLYAQAYALFQHLHRKHRTELGRFFQDLANEPAGTIPAERLVELFTQRFGSIERIERSLCH